MRKHYLDNIRWATVLLVVLYHAIFMYNHVVTAGVVGPVTDCRWQDALQYLLYPWFMVVLFLVSGASARYALDSRSGKAFFAERTRKLLVPSTLGLLVLGWAQGYFNIAFSHVFENILSFAMDLTGCSRTKAVVVNLIAIIVLSMPCVLGFNVLSGLKLPGGSVLDFEDFLVSNNLLPLGSLVYLLFCTSKYGWGFKNFMKEANTGEGLKFPKWARFYVSYILPVIVLVIFFMGYWSFFH